MAFADDLAALIPKLYKPQMKIFTRIFYDFGNTTNLRVNTQKTFILPSRLMTPADINKLRDKPECKFSSCVTRLHCLCGFVVRLCVSDVNVCVRLGCVLNGQNINLTIKNH